MSLRLAFCHIEGVAERSQQFGQGKGLRARRVDLLQIMTVDHDIHLLPSVLPIGL